MVGYRFSDNSFIRYDAEMSQTNPTLMELADTEIRLDSYLAEKGNLLLQPYLNLNNNLYYENRKGCSLSMQACIITTNTILSWNRKENMEMCS